MKTLQCVFYDNSSHVFFRPNTVPLVTVHLDDNSRCQTTQNLDQQNRRREGDGKCWLALTAIWTSWKNRFWIQEGATLYPRSSLKSTASSNVQSRTVVADSFKPHTSPGSLPRYNLTLLQGEKTHYYANQVSHQPPRLSVWGTTLPKREYCFFLLSSPF